MKYDIANALLASEATQEMLDEMLESLYHFRHPVARGDRHARVYKWLQCVQKASSHLENMLVLIALEEADMPERIREESTAMLEELVPLWNASTVPPAWKGEA